MRSAPNFHISLNSTRKIWHHVPLISLGSFPEFFQAVGSVTSSPLVFSILRWPSQWLTSHCHYIHSFYYKSLVFLMTPLLKCTMGREINTFLEYGGPRLCYKCRAISLYLTRSLIVCSMQRSNRSGCFSVSCAGLCSMSLRLGAWQTGSDVLKDTWGYLTNATNN